MKINWDWIWAEFDARFVKMTKRHECKTCKRVKIEAPDEWCNQQRMIEDIVEEELRFKKRKKNALKTKSDTPGTKGEKL